jgi:hypothetical protein
MKRLNLFVPVLAAVAALFAGTASAADEKEDILARFDRELLAVMSGFAEARESGVSSAFRQEYLGTFDRFLGDANTLQGIVTELGIGEDLNLASHARNLRNAFQAPVRTAETASSNQRDRNSRDRNRSSVAKANDPLSRITGQSLGEYAGLGSSGSGASGAAQNQSPAGFSFHMAGSAVQTLSALGFGLRNGKYSVSPRYRKILPYLEFKRDVEYFNASYEHFDSLVDIPVWRADFEKRLKRMSRLAVQIQPVYRAYFPDKSVSVGTEAERLARVYSRYVEYVKAMEQAQQAGSRLNSNNSAFDQVRQSSIPDKGLILREYDAAATRLAEFFADMDSVDWTTKPFSADGPAASDETVRRSTKSSD